MLVFCFKRSAGAALLFGALLLLILVAGFFYLGPFLTLLLFFAAELAATYTVRKIILQEFSKLSQPLFLRCDPEPYILAHEKLLRRLSSKSKLYNAARSNLAVGFYSAGETEKGIALSKKILEDPRVKRDPFLLPVVYMNLCTMLLVAGRPEEAEPMFQSAYEFIFHTPAQSPLGRKLRSQMNLLELRRRVLTHQSQRCEESLTANLQRASSLYERVQIQYLLFLCYQQQGETGPMLSCLRYVAEKGNHLEIARQAQAILNDFSSEG